MKYLIAFLFSLNAYANQARITWTTNSYLEGSPLTETAFRILWGVEGQGMLRALDFGPPAPLPMSFVGGQATWQQMAYDQSWMPGRGICFQLIVLVSGIEMVRSQPACYSISPIDPTNVFLNF